MQNLATGVGDLKKVLSNVKTKGVLGEYQLENILEQLLTNTQYAKNVKTKAESDAFVEFAIRLPGKEDSDKEVWLPVDSKFPTEDYQSLMDAHDNADTKMIDASRKELARKIKMFAQDIRTKYVDPPNTTDFAILFLPIEGLYAEVLRDSGLFESLQRDYKIIVTGPTTLSALLSSLQMGFRTLAIEKRSSEVWEILGAVKTEFGKFGAVLEKTQKKLTEASNVVESAGQRSRAIERKLKNVEELPSNKSMKLLDTGTNDDKDE
jgi:DNA recombination protein RmuC